ncbi:hypothetical protein AX15_006007 [Amanita polypyramis BW_CC]|nr:hypothetical protein AX15_006007 [Amanita polypyramis BW_CC]
MTPAEHGAEKVVIEAEHPGKVIRTPRTSKISDQRTLGLFAFAVSIFTLSWYNVQIRGITKPNVLIGGAFTTGGLALVLAGMWEFPRGNTFYATVFSTYGSFWISYAVILTPGFGVAQAFGSNEQELLNAIGIYLVTWFIITFIFFVAAFRKSIGFAAMLFCVLMMFLFLAIGAFLNNTNVNKAGGGFGIAASLIALYVGISVLLADADEPLIRLPIGVMSKRID